MVKHGGSVTTKQKENLRQESQKVNSIFMKARRNPIRGFIYELRPAPDNDYFYQVRVRPDHQQDSSPTNSSTNMRTLTVADSWLPLVEDPAVIALLYGDKDMILGARCRVEFASASPRTGMVFIEFDPGKIVPNGNTTEYDNKAFLYAPAGSGKVL